MKHQYLFLSSQSMSKLKMRARDLKRNTDLSHIQALEHVAQETERFKNWKQVTDAAARYAPFEQAMARGCVVAFDPKEAPERSKFCDGKIFYWSNVLEQRMTRDVLDWWADERADYEDDPQGRPNRVVLGQEQIREACIDLYGLMEIYIAPDIPQAISLDQFLEGHVHRESFFSPTFVWLKGQFHSL